MRAAVAIAVLLAVVGTALVGVHEQAEICRLRYRVFEAERRRDALVRQLRELSANVSAATAPRGLLEEYERGILGRASVAPRPGDPPDPDAEPPADAAPPTGEENP